jgi:hypothetical protein
MTANPAVTSRATTAHTPETQRAMAKPPKLPSMPETGREGPSLPTPPTRCQPPDPSRLRSCSAFFQHGNARIRLPHDRDSLYREGAPGEAVDPRSIEVKKVGEKTTLPERASSNNRLPLLTVRGRWRGHLDSALSIWLSAVQGAHRLGKL